ncbi:MAG: hypothetical protein JST38_12180 [Bacteroidetes bacterium]|nr:hypothetical protein [Bacteroidota bacterium]MBS1568281.1 hypothetical protein [Bacteroidota bacterium]MBS1941622.1 hypothetical protein [Bacteroidota bacterium]
MHQTKASDRMNELIRSVQHALGLLEEGKLDLPGLEQCTEDARSIFERLVVLRHKAREAHVEAEKRAAQAGAKPPEPAAPIRLDTRPPDVHPQQTSLIDAIAETETAPAPKPKPAPPAPEPLAAEAPKPPKARPAAPQAGNDRPASVADKMEHAPVADLRKAIALSQKFWFVAELFANERDRYEKALDAINGMHSASEAEAFVRDEVLAKLPKPPGEEVANTFLELVKRRFR